MDAIVNFFTNTFQNVVVHSLTAGLVLGLFVLALLLFLSALMSGTEVAYFSLTPSEVAHINEKKHPIHKYVKVNLDNPERLLATILIGNNLINVGIVILAAYLTDHIFDFTLAPIAGFVIQVIVITFILLLFGEIMPKIIAANRALKFAVFMAAPINILSKLFWPFNTLLIKSTSIISKKLSKHQTISMDELSDALDIANENLTDEKKILKGIVSFGTTIASEIMKPRLDIVAVDYTTPYTQLKEVVIKSGYSRIPVFDEDLDTIKGVLYVKDLIPFIENDDTFSWQNLMREPYFVPESKRINDLLSEFQKKRIHLAVVVDEYGGTSGIVTLEDVLEEIVGEISDESDEEKPMYVKVDDKHFVFEGKVLLNDFYKIMNCEDDVFDDVRGDSETLAGLILEITGQFPSKNDEIKCKNFNFTIEALDNKRIKSVKVEVLNENPADEEELDY
ncbi:MAG TPA: gliding motility-associated protein GldE [Tenuifilaceae bacterium]|nr:gliding motility-associated protein GldE [Tenuifilaceae bacterium]